MKRRKFLSALLAAPMALEARLLAFFARKPVAHCDAPILAWSAPRYILMQSLATFRRKIQRSEPLFSHFQL